MCDSQQCPFKVIKTGTIFQMENKVTFSIRIKSGFICAIRFVFKATDESFAKACKMWILKQKHSWSEQTDALHPVQTSFR